MPDGEVVLRVTPGPHADRLDGPLDGAAFTVSPRSDRTAVRLEGPAVYGRGDDVVTIGVLPGAVQLPADGQPIVLLGNCQTTGGYPVVAVVCAADLRLAAQLRPGAVVRLVTVSVAAAARACGSGGGLTAVGLGRDLTVGHPLEGALATPRGEQGAVLAGDIDVAGGHGSSSSGACAGDTVVLVRVIGTTDDPLCLPLV